MEKINELILNKTIMQSNTSGPFIILKNLGNVNGRYKVLIKFINTGSLCEVLSHNALAHRVKDPALQNISNDFDINRFEDYDKYIDNLLITTYKHMIDRCYNTKSSKYKSYGAIGVRVCNEWLSDINIFLKDAREIDGFNKFYLKPYLYQLDKDYKQMNIPKQYRIYSKNTCTFLYYQDNANIKVIENKKHGMYGIEINSAGNYYARIKINGNRMNIGTFSNEIAAANAYNFWHLYFHNFELVPLLNDVPYMSPQEFFKYNVNPKILCTSIQQ